MANFRDFPWLVVMGMLLSISSYGVEVPVIPPLPEPFPLLSLLPFFPRRRVPSEFVPEFPEPALGDPVDPGEPAPGEPVDPDEPAPDPEPLPAPCAKTEEAGVSADNNIAKTIFFMIYISFLSGERRQGPFRQGHWVRCRPRRNYGCAVGEQAADKRGRSPERKVQGTSDISLATAAFRGLAAASRS
jgi:hypothetical protein